MLKPERTVAFTAHIKLTDLTDKRTIQAAEALIRRLVVMGYDIDWAELDLDVADVNAETWDWNEQEILDIRA